MKPARGAKRAGAFRRRSRWLVAAGLVLLARVPALEAEPKEPIGSGGALSPAADRERAQDSATAHDPSHPPIDCPLRDAGVDPAHVRPFADVEQYIAFLERTDRAAWQKPDEVIAALGLRGGETVVDLGAGSGYFAFRLAKVLPRGKVIAADTEAEMIRHIHHKVMTESVQNVQAVLIQPADPGIPAEADLVFVCDVLHHVADRAAWLDKLVAQMKAGARLVLIEFKEGHLPEGPPESAKITRAQMLELMTKAGLTLVSERAELLPYQTFLVFRKPS
jgi:ubiquinone/menaquinone biosynthesis C-methylase UbiE